MLGGGGASYPLLRDGGAGEFREVPTLQSSHATRSGPEIKNGRSRNKDSAPERLSNPGGELDPAIDVRLRCKNSPSVLSCIGKRTKNA